jgi:hypothetical protein
VSKTVVQVYELYQQAMDVPEGEERISRLEEAVRVADASGELRLQYFARDQLVSACIFGGETDKALVAYSWCLAQFDQNPGEFSQWTILWKYKWMVGLIPDFPHVPKKKLYLMLDDLEERIQKAGYGLRAVYNQRYRLEKFRDNKEKAIEYFRQMEEQPRDDVSNCSACEIDERVGFNIYCGNDARALQLANPIINGIEKCGSVPHRTYANLLLPLVRMGRRQEALEFHQLGYPLIANNKRYLDRIGDHLILLAITENFVRAQELFEKHYPWTEKSRDPFCRFRFLRASWLLFDLLAERGETSVQLNLPTSFPLFSESGKYETLKLAQWLEQAATELAKRFDQRNETDAFARMMTETSSLKELSQSFPLS